MRLWMRALLTIGVLALILASAKQYTAEESSTSLRAWFLDIGQGDAILLETPERAQILIDGGPNSSILRELSRAMPIGDKEIDLVISTHNDADHLAGLNDVLQHYQIDKIWMTGALHTTDTYRTFLELIKIKGIPVQVVTAGTQVEFGALKGLAIAPQQNWQGILPDQQNSTGIVSLWEYGSQTLLLTGDIEEEQEQELLERHLLRPVSILKVAHHGSKTSSSEAFLEATRPEIAVISVGQHNRYGHPAPSIVERLTKLKIPILRTDQDGTIVFSVTADSFSYQIHR